MWKLFSSIAKLIQITARKMKKKNWKTRIQKNPYHYLFSILSCDFSKVLK